MKNVASTETAKKGIRLRLDVLDRLLAGKGVHPPKCDCATKSRNARFHMRSCPYRILKSIFSSLRKIV